MSSASIRVTTNAVIIAVLNGTPFIRTISDEAGLALPSGTLEDFDRTIQESIRRWVFEQTNLELGYVEQLYTFGDADRLGDVGKRSLSITYLALVLIGSEELDESWVSLYELFPWEDARSGTSSAVREELRSELVALSKASADGPSKMRVDIAFPSDDKIFDGIKALERYELMYESGLLAEAESVKNFGTPMSLDHRRIASTALSRIRGKLTYRPVVFELIGSKFTLRELQTVVEGLLGKSLHTQNFRRLVEQGGLVSGTGEMSVNSGGGRPAELFSFRSEVLLERPRPGFK